MMQLHGTTVAIEGRGILILGPSGAGKSSLALELMACGGQLVADDRTDLTRAGDGVLAGCPAPLLGRIEARGIGILRAAPCGPVRLSVVVDLGQPEPERLPVSRQTDLLGIMLPLVFGPYRPHLYAALRQLVLAGRAV